MFYQIEQEISQKIFSRIESKSRCSIMVGYPIPRIIMNFSIILLWESPWDKHGRKMSSKRSSSREKLIFQIAMWLRRKIHVKNYNSKLTLEKASCSKMESTYGHNRKSDAIWKSMVHWEFLIESVFNLFQLQYFKNWFLS